MRRGPKPDAFLTPDTPLEKPGKLEPQISYLIESAKLNTQRPLNYVGFSDIWLKYWQD